MEYSFAAEGHPNILATHATTIEFTKDRELTHRGNCIVAVEADFSLQQLQKFLNFKKIRIIIAVAGEKEVITAVPNHSFSSSREIVIRRSDFASDRTFAIKADKAAIDIDRKLVNALKNRAKASIKVTDLLL
jgi:hypothetical protein